MSQDIEALKSRIAELEAAVGIAETDRNKFNLPPSPRKLFGLLLAAENVTTAMIAGTIPGDTDPKIQIFRLRKLLAPRRITIHSRRHVGYWIDAATKPCIRRGLTVGVIGGGCCTALAPSDNDEVLEREDV